MGRSLPDLNVVDLSDDEGSSEKEEVLSDTIQEVLGLLIYFEKLLEGLEKGLLGVYYGGKL